jgi:PKD repeat protein
MGWTPETRRWEWENDDADPLHTDWSALSTNDLDERVRKWVLPVKQAIEANGDRMYVQISPSFYDTGSSGEAFPWFLRSPGEYMEYAMSVILRLKDVHGIEPDTYTICNEPQYNNAFSESITQKMAKALGRRMQEAGLRTGIQYPESMSDASAITWLQNAQNDPELWKYVRTVSYHLYGPRTNLEAIRDIAFSKGVPTAQTEFLAGNSLADDYLYDDMTLGQVSEWHSYVQTFPVPFANGTSFDRRPHYWLFRQFMPYVRPGAVRVAAVSGDSTVRPLAFTKNGEVTVLLINTMTASSNQTVTLNGLPNGQYGVCQSISEALPTELGIQTVTNGQLNVYLAKNAFVTVYPHNSGNQPPLVLQWQSSDAYLRLGVSSSTTLSVDAMDPELDALSYQWSVATNPPGASVVFATPTNKSCAVSGLTAEGEYAFAVTVSDATHSKTREVIIKSFNGNQPPILLDVHQRIPIRIIQPASSTTLRAAAKDVEGSSCTLLWSIVSQPAGASAVLTDPTNSSCVVTGLTALGSYTVRITASDGTDTASQDLSFNVYPQDVNPPVISNLSGTLNTNGSGHLSATTSDADGDWISHWWEQASGPTNAKTYFSAQGSPVSEVYADTAGSYQFRLIAVGPNQYANSATVSLTLSNTAAPSASFTVSPASGWAPLTVTFTDNSSGTVTNRFWDFGDGFTTNTADAAVAHTYASAGSNTVQLIVSGPLGASTNTQINAVVVAAPVPPSANFTASPTNGPAPLNVTFTDTSTGSITNRYWNFGDGGTTNTVAANVTHVYASAGTNTVQLIVSGPAGTSTNTQINLIDVASSVLPEGQVAYDPFDSAVTVPLVLGWAPPGWTTDGTTANGDRGYIKGGSLSYPGLPASEGNSFGLGAGTDDYFLNFPAVTLAVGDTVYFSFIEKYNVIPGASVTGVGGFLRLANSADAVSTTKGICISRGSVGTPAASNAGFAIATANKTFGVSPAVSTPGTYDMLATYLIVGSYTRGATATAGSLKLWINPDAATFGTANPPAPTLSMASASSADTFNQLRIGANGSNSHPTDWQIDEVRVGTNWFSVVPSASVSVPAPVITSTLSATGTVDQAFSYQITADNTPLSFNATGLPSGLSVNTNSGAITGTPIAEGSNSVTISASNAGGTDSKTLAIVIAAVPVDGNGNGIPDAWENQHGITNSNPHAMAANGINTVLESYIAGMNPTNPAERFHVSAQQSASQRLLQWSAASGRVYSVYWTTNLLSGFQPLETNLVWPQNSWTGQVSGAPGEFYKIKVQLAP